MSDENGQGKTKALQKYIYILQSLFGLPTSSHSCKGIENVKLNPVFSEQLEVQDSLKNTKKLPGWLSPMETFQAGHGFCACAPNEVLKTSV